jgi:hypothetical protein
LIVRIIVFLCINGYFIQSISSSTRRPLIPYSSPKLHSLFLQILYLPEDIFPQIRKVYQYIIMTAIAPVEVGLPFSEAQRSPLSISSDSSRRSSLRQRLPEKDSDLPTPSSPLFRLTRKRAASLDTESANDPRIEDLALNSARSNGLPTSDSTREQVCLCQPDPKIPRPRNGV